uniref:Secreted protein n=1 Tax=Streptomyces sp. NBC_00049 TaxID=2903617 RepID=A0AAU2JVH8_9ACTN
MQTMRRTKHAAVRAAVLATAALAAALCGIVPAQAAEGDGIAGYPSAQQAVRSDQLRDTVSRFLVSARQAGTAPAADGGAVGAPGNAPAAVAAPPGFDLKDPVPMFEISPEFVTGKARATPETALRLSYLASRVTASDGKHAAVLLAPKGNAGAAEGAAQNVGAEGWQLAGIRDGDTEVGFAERGTPQARTFTEPQIHAWYRLTAEGVVEPLNEEATTGLGGKPGVTLAAYQKLVTARYGDKMPGSEYDRKGLAGGYAGLVEDQQQEQVAAASGIPAAETPWQPIALTGTAALAAIGGAVAYARRRGTAATR